MLNSFEFNAEQPVTQCSFPATIARYALFSMLALSLAACGGNGSDGGDTSNNTEYTVTLSAGDNGSFSPDTKQTVQHGNTTSVTLSPDAGYGVDNISGCDGEINGDTYTTGTITADCTIKVSFATTSLNLTPTAVKTFRFSWTELSAITEYRLLENPDGMSVYTEVATLAGDASSHDLEVFLPERTNASYILQTCNSNGCSDSAPVFVNDNLVEAIGYVKASNASEESGFGARIALSGDSNTLAVAAVGNDSSVVYIFTHDGTAWLQQAILEDSNPNEFDGFGWGLALSYDGNTLAAGATLDDSEATNSGAVYIFTRNGSNWSRQAYIKASNADADDKFGWGIALAGDGNTLAVGATGERSNAIGIDGDQDNNDAIESGAVYVFTRSDSTWAQQAYVKASNTGWRYEFGRSVALSKDGNTLAVGAMGEESNATGTCSPSAGCDSSQADNTATDSGAAYVFTRSGASWTQQSYIKASNTEKDDRFGFSVALADDGNTLAVGALGEDSNATGIDSDQNSNTAIGSGAVYVFTRSEANWSQQAYVKASNTGEYDSFGIMIALSDDGNTLAVGAREDSNATGIDGDESDNTANNSGAVYLFTREDINWSQQAYVKAPNANEDDYFLVVALSGDGKTLAVGADGESSNATGIGGDQSNNDAQYSGAVYLY